MRLEQALFNHLSTHAGLMAVVGDRIYPYKRPQGCAFPAVTYRRVSGARVRTFGGSTGKPRIQVDCCGKSYADAKAVADQVIAALEGFTGLLGGPGGVPVSGIQLDNELDDDEPDAGVYTTILDFFVWHEGN
jgi:hypothetical protein